MRGAGSGGMGSAFARVRKLFAAAKRDSWVLPYLSRYRKALAASLILGAVAMLFAAGLMFASGYLIDSAAERPELGLFSLLVPLGFVQVFGVGKPFLSYVERLASHDWVLRVTSDLQAKLFATVSAKGRLWARTRRAGEVLGLLNDDIAHAQNLYLRCVFPAAIALVAWIIATLVFGISSPAAAGILCVALFVLVAVLPLCSVLVNAARVERAKRHVQDEQATLSDAIAGLDDWVIAGRRADFVRELHKAGSSRDRQLEELDCSVRRFQLAGHLAFTILCACVLVWAALHFQSGTAAGMGELRPQDFIAAFALGLFPLLDAFAPLPAAATGSLQHLDSITRLNDLGCAPSIADDGGSENQSDGRQSADSTRDCDSTPGQDSDTAEQARLGERGGAAELRLDGVGFVYEDAGKDALRDIDLVIPAGQKVAILGPSGCGKSTLLSLIRGDLTPTTGSVTLEGVPTCRLGSRASELVGLVEQDPYVFNRTLRDNVTLGDESITREAALSALKAVGLSDLLARLPKGIDTLVDEAGVNFSGGERHRIALARVLVRNAGMVMFDEPTASLDPFTEMELIDTLFDTMADRTVLFVTHHLACIERFDRVLFMEQGRVVLDGSPEEFYQHSERYRSLLAFDRGL